ncbi:MAG TPA: type I pantothenate kinase, partial [Thermoplasmataceae archaeon]|nr:type I pantothenate kinase [Thermoplasmataceae archaeon]
MPQEARNPVDLTPYISIDREAWADLRNSTPMTLTEQDFQKLLGLNEKIALDEVEEVYLPLSRLLSLHFTASLGLYGARNRFFGKTGVKVPYIIGIAGSVAVGKSTTARILQSLVSKWDEKPRVSLVPTDGFLFPNRILEEKNLLNKKGFPESFDVKSLLNFLLMLKSGVQDVSMPVYSHLEYDIIPGEKNVLVSPDVVIVEGLNVLQTSGRYVSDKFPGLSVSDFFDFSLYVDAEEINIKRWYLERFLMLKETAFRNERSYFHKFSYLSEEEAVD